MWRRPDRIENWRDWQESLNCSVARTRSPQPSPQREIRPKVRNLQTDSQISRFIQLGEASAYRTASAKLGF
ncbi:hypothetical protein CKA32_004630 [Geitlerinema sp. FC II]|uniref:hypothetical protein n=1 Tax=Baaleninema simplex TaxID=2862350 RepID=UPI000348F15A|nr:hypothetical protein [Baaleninema simplex]MDC0832410.1 hypothetical protein [Geitlerinema sp. CS-897]PPT07442.1 hypothetical protein CKA32_004630 [Geitlerinema sp. FC II]